MRLDLRGVSLAASETKFRWRLSARIRPSGNAPPGHTK